MAIAKNLLLLLMSSLMLAALVTTMPLANVANVDHAHHAVVPSKHDSRHLIITSCGILGNSCAFATTLDVAPTSDDDVKPEEKDSNDETASNLDMDTPTASTDDLAAVAPAETDTELDPRAPKLIITSCGIWGSSCAFTESDNISAPSNAESTDTGAHDHELAGLEDKEANHISDSSMDNMTNLPAEAPDGDSILPDPSSTAFTCSGSAVAIAGVADSVNPQ